MKKIFLALTLCILCFSCYPKDSVIGKEEISKNTNQSINKSENHVLILPAYIYPEQVSGLREYNEWQKIYKACETLKEDAIIVLNPNSGSGSSENSDYADTIKKISSYNSKAIGYLPTGYGEVWINPRDENWELKTDKEIQEEKDDISKDFESSKSVIEKIISENNYKNFVITDQLMLAINRVNKWIDLYAADGLKGFFLDETGYYDWEEKSLRTQNENYYPKYYKIIEDYINYILPSAVIVNNLGSDSQYEKFKNLNSILCISERTYENHKKYYTETDLEYDKTCVLIYEFNNFDNFEKLDKSSFKYLYVTDDTSSDPWDKLATYFNKLVKAIETMNN